MFGTDGVRGVANVELTPELALSLGRATALAFGGFPDRLSVVVGRDTRPSGDLLECAFGAGLLSAGADMLRCGVMPTPAVAFLVTDLGAHAGAVISASHNPASDNGIKLFGPDGFKLTDAQEGRIEQLLGARSPAPSGGDVGRARGVDDAEHRYVTHAVQALEGRGLDGLKVVVDCANGAAYRTTPEALLAAGADVVVLNADFDGGNINVGCGSNAPDVVARAVIEHRADAGLAHDGDADRVVAVDEGGNLVDGDAMIAMLALELHEQGRLRGDLVVTTVMANLGFRLAMASAGIRVVETPVGDRSVIGAMRGAKAVLGGEQSGHVIFTEHATTGDGLITGLRVLGRMVSTGRALSELARVVERVPQVLLNVPVDDRGRLEGAHRVWEAVADAESRLGDEGRVLLRSSGTESVVRVMVESVHEGAARALAGEIAAVVREELGGR